MAQVTLYPTSDRNVQLNPSVGTSNWACVAKSTPDDSTYVWVTGMPAVDDYGWSPHGIPAGSEIDSIAIFARVKDTEYCYVEMNPQHEWLRNEVIGSTWTDVSAVWELDPAMGMKWSWEQVDGMGPTIVLGNTLGPTAMCSQLYAIITYHDPNTSAYLRPATNISVEWTPLTDTNANMVKEVLADDDATYNYITNNFGLDIFTHGGHNIPSNANISSIVVFARMANTAMIGLRIVQMGTLFSGYGGAGGVGYTDGTYVWTANPESGDYWTVADLDYLRLGYYGGVGSGEARCTQLYAIVNYTIPSSFITIISVT